MPASAPALTELLDILPKGIVPTKARTRLNKLIDELDQLLFVDSLEEVSVDRSTLMRIAGNSSLVPAEIKDHVLVETSKHLGRRIKEFKKGNRRIRWVDGGSHGLPIHPMSPADVKALGITSKTTTDEIEKILRKRLKDSPPGAHQGSARRVVEVPDRAAEDQSELLGLLGG